MIAALYVDPKGPYWGRPDVDAWDEARDARLYAGPWPVVAHPPCSRWCQLAGLVESRYGHMRGDDGGCFAAALAAVRRWGGVLEHPAESAAWAAHGLLRPPRKGGWVSAGDWIGWTCCVEQGHYGHRARKATWLYVVGAASLPSLRWGPSKASAVVSFANRRSDPRPRLRTREASATPPAFAEVLESLATSVTVERMGHLERRLTPIAFGALLESIAAGCKSQEERAEGAGEEQP
jgi:hypothetical protein